MLPHVELDAAQRRVAPLDDLALEEVRKVPAALRKRGQMNLRRQRSWKTGSEPSTKRCALLEAIRHSSFYIGPYKILCRDLRYEPRLPLLADHEGAAEAAPVGGDDDGPEGLVLVDGPVPARTCFITAAHRQS